MNVILVCLDLHKNAVVLGLFMGHVPVTAIVLVYRVPNAGAQRLHSQIYLIGEGV